MTANNGWDLEIVAGTFIPQTICFRDLIHAQDVMRILEHDGVYDCKLSKHIVEDHGG